MAEFLVALLVFFVADFNPPQYTSWTLSDCTAEVYHAEHPCLVGEW